MIGKRKVGKQIIMNECGKVKKRKEKGTIKLMIKRYTI